MAAILMTANRPDSTVSGVEKKMTSLGHTRQPSARKQLASIIEGWRDEIERRWLRQVLADVTGHSIDPTRLRNALPHYLDRLAESLRCEPSLGAGGTAAWVDVAREHAVTRVHLGFDVRQLVHEFAILRRVLVGVVSEAGQLDVEQTESIAELIESAVEEAVDSYVRARDYEARRVEGEHIGFVAHELRSPLTAALMAFDQMRSGPVSQGDKRLALIDRSLRRMAALIEDTLQCRRLEAHAMEVNCERLTMGELFEPPVESATASAHAKGIELNADYDAKAVVQVDRKLTTSAIQNLLDNAVKFTNRGKVNLEVEKRSNEIVVHVTDTGPGISKEELGIIFEPFRRGSRQRQTPGSGLGLAIAKKAIETQRGSIHCESEPGTGCHFWFTLPISGLE